ncbi:MAG: double-strand break repair protein AddB [Alphaproteobacteria bacterium HGW-Alphaproteobacteria-11]|nr:MAG: double-strand break repair protein AddB [Alphaproteobacteria bacterium HGW-Alphaproteobacteria-11]
MPADSRTLFTMPPGTPFLERLAATLLDDATLGGRFGASVLADITILLPTRRAVRALGEAFLRAGGGTALILPSIRTLGDVDEDDLVLDPKGMGAHALDLPPAMPPLERQLHLARMIVAGRAEDETRALALAADLGRFLDMGLTEGVDLATLAHLVPDEFADHWQITLEFLKLLTAAWPHALEQMGYMEQAERRNRLIRAQADLWRAHPPVAPVIAAGSTGSIPATADLLKVIAALPNGAVVLPGLDLDLDAESWAVIGEPGTASHPQYGMSKLLRHLDAAREDVALWPGCETTEASPRARLLSEALRPAETTERWRARLAPLKKEASAAIDGLTMIEAAGERDEAGAIALLMRETVETPAKTAALVTPDRKLARRVAMELRRWKIEVDDSGGEPLAQTTSLTFMRLVAAMIAEDFAPVALLACLKHPLAAAGEDPAHFRAHVRTMESIILRGPRPAPGIAGLRMACAAEKQAREESGRITAAFERDLAETHRLLDTVERDVLPMVEAWRDAAPLDALVCTHVETAERLSATATEPGASRLWAREEGEAAADFIRELIDAAPAFGPLDAKSYPRFFDQLAEGRVLRPRWGRHPRLFIWGPLEARLQHADRIILGGLNEGTWPAEAGIDPWLNRPMRAALGLDPPERRIGLAAHDFVESTSAKEAILTRAAKVEGAPTVASRWWLRLASVLTGLGQENTPRAPHWTLWAHDLDKPAAKIDPVRPRPAPPLDARPDGYSVTEIETLIRDPYAIYAKKILKLPVLDDLDADIAAAERGMIVHKALEKFVAAFPEELPDHALRKLLEIGEGVFENAMERPGVAAFWWPRFRRIARWMIEYERGHRPDVTRSFAETLGEIEIDGLRRPVILRGKADRIDLMKDGTLGIADYKTGSVPSKKQVEIGLSPQLPLEAAMAARGGFRDKGLPEARASRLVYLRLTGGETAGEERVIPDPGGDLAEEIFARLVDLLKQYESEATPYLSRPRPKFTGRYGDYDHLARVKEWSASGGEGE